MDDIAVSVTFSFVMLFIEKLYSKESILNYEQDKK